jgi:hypothetical protein
MPETVSKSTVQLDISQAQQSLEKLERSETHRWTTALLIILALTTGFFVAIPQRVACGMFEDAHLQTAQRGLLGVVLLFIVYVLRQRTVIGRLRRQLATQIATLATMEALKPLSAEEQRGQSERRRWPRYPVDELLRLEIHGKGKAVEVYGRLCDISECGAGAVIPDALELGGRVMLRFSLCGGVKFWLTATVRHRRGFHYGFEFVGVSDNERAKLNDTLAQLQKV